jgi:DNA (cytosine-5)-methyltransferase 1
MNIKADNLDAAKKRIVSLQRQINARILAMAAEVEGLLSIMPAKDAKAFLRVTCGVSASEIPTYVGFSKKLKGCEETLRASRASFPVVKALLGAEDDAREEVLARMDLGARVDVGDISAIRKRLRDSKLSPRQVVIDRNRKVVKAAARKRSLAATEAFQADLATLLMKLNGAGTKERAALTSSESFRGDASALFHSFDQLFGSDPSAPVIGPDAVNLAAARDGLQRLSEGRFEGAEHYPDRRLTPDSNLEHALRKLAGLPTRGLIELKGLVLNELPPHRLRLNAIELCAGAGGMALGLERAGFNHAALFEFDRHAAATLRLNRPQWNVLEEDIRSVDFRPYRDKNIALVAGGLPCQPYAQGGHGKGKDDPRDLLLDGVRIVTEILPKAFLFENVEGLLHARHANHFAHVLAGFRKAGYEVDVHRLDASDFGIAQERERILIVGLRKEYAGLLRMPPAFPARRATLGDVLGDLMAANGWRGAKDWAKARREQAVLDKYGSVVGIGALAPTLETSQGTRRDNSNAVWLGKGIDPKKLSTEAPTDDEGSAEGFLPGLTPRMRARLQDLPDDWQFAGGKASVVKQIGNAVPPRLAQAAGLALFAAIRNMQFDWEAMLWPGSGQRVEVDVPAIDGGMEVAQQEAVPRVLEDV